MTTGLIKRYLLLMIRVLAVQEGGRLAGPKLLGPQNVGRAGVDGVGKNLSGGGSLLARSIGVRLDHLLREPGKLAVDRGEIG